MAEFIEQWRPVVGFEGRYEVSNLGQVHSIARTITRSNGVPQFINSRIIRTRPGARGYITIQLWRDNKAHIYTVHRLVAAAWIGPRPDGLQVRHLDGDKTNNRADNLAYGTNSENQLDAVRHGTHNMSGKTHCKRGHEFTSENTYSVPGGGRACRACRTMHGTAYRCKKAAHQ